MKILCAPCRACETGQRQLSTFYGQNHIATLDIKFRHKNSSSASSKYACIALATNLSLRQAIYLCYTKDCRREIREDMFWDFTGNR